MLGPIRPRHLIRSGMQHNWLVILVMRYFAGRFGSELVTGGDDTLYVGCFRRIDASAIS